MGIAIDAFDSSSKHGETTRVQRKSRKRLVVRRVRMQHRVSRQLALLHEEQGVDADALNYAGRASCLQSCCAV